MDYVDYVYDIVKSDTEGMDAIYKDYIIQMVGVYGFNALYYERLLEGCGVVNDRKLFVLCDKYSRKNHSVLQKGGLRSSLLSLDLWRNGQRTRLITGWFWVRIPVDPFREGSSVGRAGKLWCLVRHQQQLYAWYVKPRVSGSSPLLPIKDPYSKVTNG